MYIKSLSDAWAGGYGYVQNHTPDIKRRAEDNWKAVVVIVAIAAGAYFQWGKLGLFLAFSTLSVFYQVAGLQIFENVKKFTKKDIAVISGTWLVAGTAGWLQMGAVCLATGTAVWRLLQQYQAQKVIQDEKEQIQKEKEQIQKEKELLKNENVTLKAQIAELLQVLSACDASVNKILTNNGTFIALVGDAERLGDLSASETAEFKKITARLELVNSAFAKLNKDGTIPQHILDGGLSSLTATVSKLSEQNGALKTQLEFVDKRLRTLGQELNQFQPAQLTELKVLQKRMEDLEKVLLEIKKQRGIQ